jgi:hypothetical protein
MIEELMTLGFGHANELRGMSSRQDVSSHCSPLCLLPSSAETMVIKSQLILLQD